jgi:hypothetical protein
MKEKVDLARQIIETKLLPTDWIYHNVFHLSQDQYDEYRDLVLEDAKRDFRLNQIKEEGNDPKITGKSYGTPHDLAALYGKGRTYSNPENVPVGYGDDIKLGRPEEKVSNIGTQGNAFGKDRIGKISMKTDDQENYGKTNHKGGSPLALETAQIVYNKNKSLIESLNKSSKLIKEDNNVGLLDENQLRE